MSSNSLDLFRTSKAPIEGQERRFFSFITSDNSKELGSTQNQNLEVIFESSSTNSSLYDLNLEHYLFKIIPHNVSTERPQLQDFTLLFLSPRSYSLGEILKNNNRGGGKTHSFYHDESYLPNNISGSINSKLQGNFYINTLTYQSLNLLISEPELLNLSNNLTRHNHMINSLRWSYRYNNLHRRSIYNSHKLTGAKRLLSMGYFDSSVTTNNM
jgi:hypothetical protein